MLDARRPAGCESSVGLPRDIAFGRDASRFQGIAICRPLLIARLQSSGILYVSCRWKMLGVPKNRVVQPRWDSMVVP